MTGGSSTPPEGAGAGLGNDRQPRGKRTEAEIRHVARSRALTDLAEKYPIEFEIYQTARRQELRAEQATNGVVSRMGPRPRHRPNDDNTCRECGEAYPCPAALRRKEFSDD